MASNRSKPLPASLRALRKKLDSHYHARNVDRELSLGAPDPLRVARRYGAHKHGAEIALICALLSYGNARAIVRFLEGLDFSQLDRLVEFFQNLESQADSESVSAVGRCPTAIESSFSSKRCLEQALKASSGWGQKNDSKGEGASLRAVAQPQTHTCTFKPLPLNKKEKEILSTHRILEAKAKDSETLDSESEMIKIQEAKAKDSESSETDLTTKHSAVVSQTLGGAAEFTSASQDRACELRLARSAKMESLESPLKHDTQSASASFRSKAEFHSAAATPRGSASDNSEAKMSGAYRFQTSEDIATLFIIMARVIRRGGIEAMFMEAYHHAPKPFLAQWSLSANANHARILYAIYACIENLSALAPMPLTRGLGFALGKSYAAHIRARGSLPPNVGALKRWNMYLRWMVRADRLDMGLWRGLSRADLILPLDTHTFRLCGELEILARRSYDLAAALQATDMLTILRPDDPIAYDFALYRLGQSGGNLWCGGLKRG